MIKNRGAPIVIEEKKRKRGEGSKDKSGKSVKQMLMMRRGVWDVAVC